MRTRFAPSPTGLLHVGHGFAALGVARRAEAMGGEWLLRIEDIDQTRCRPEFEEAIYEDLAWLGLDWPRPVRRQSDHLADYEAVLARLRDMGLVYRCFRTRREVMEEIARAPHFHGAGPDGPAFIGAPLAEEDEEALLADGAPFAWRLSLCRVRDHLGADYTNLCFEETGTGPAGEAGLVKAAPEIFGDPVIARKDAGTSYHLAVTHDDALQGITEIVRGQDLFAATHLHVLMQRLMGWPTPQYHHHRLITDDQGKKFSKRDQSVTLRALREGGADPTALGSELSLR